MVTGRFRLLGLSLGDTVEAQARASSQGFHTVGYCGAKMCPPSDHVRSASLRRSV